MDVEVTSRSWYRLFGHRHVLAESQQKSDHVEDRCREVGAVNSVIPQQTCQASQEVQYQEGFLKAAKNYCLHLFVPSHLLEGANYGDGDDDDDDDDVVPRGVVKTSRFCERRKYRCFCTAKTLKRPLKFVRSARGLKLFECLI